MTVNEIKEYTKKELKVYTNSDGIEIVPGDDLFFGDQPFDEWWEQDGYKGMSDKAKPVGMADYVLLWREIVIDSYGWKETKHRCGGAYDTLEDALNAVKSNANVADYQVCKKTV